MKLVKHSDGKPGFSFSPEPSCGSLCLFERPSSGLAFFSETFPSRFSSRPVVEPEALDGAQSPAAPLPQQNTY